MKKLYAFCLALIASFSIYASPADFITTWQTTISNESITIPTSGGGYTYSVDWGDSTPLSTNVTANASHSYASAGTYTVTISGVYPQISFGSMVDSLKLLSVQQWGTQAWTSMHNAFKGCANLTVSNSAGLPNLTSVTDMSGMFSGCASFNTSIIAWNVSNVTNMAALFMGCTTYNQALCISSSQLWNVSLVTDMSEMFKGCTSFNQNMGINQFARLNVSKVTNMSSMFEGCSSFNGTIWPMNPVKTSNMSKMFKDCSSFNQFFGSNQTVSLKNAHAMFQNCTSFNNSVSDMRVDSVTDMSYMFYGCANMTDGGGYLIEFWGSNNRLSQVTNMSYMFYGCSKFDFNASNKVLNVSNVTNMDFMFYGCSAFRDKYDSQLNRWNISKVESMKDMLTGTAIETVAYDAILTAWATLTVKPNVEFGVNGMTFCTGEPGRNTLKGAPNNWTFVGDYKDCDDSFTLTVKTDNSGTSTSTEFTLPTTGGGYTYDVDWENDGIFDDFGVTGSITHDYGVAGTHTLQILGAFPRIYFNDTGDKLKLVGISQWGVNPFTSMEKAFKGCANLVVDLTIPYTKPNLAGVTNASEMFSGCAALQYNSLNAAFDLGSWDVSTLTNMKGMFSSCTNLNESLNGWNVANVIDMRAMFYDASSFNGNLASWQTSSVTRMDSMFYGCGAFNQNLNAWNTGNVLNMRGMLTNCVGFNKNLASFDIANVANMSNMLDNANISTYNYYLTLGSWANQSVQSNVTLGAALIEYCTAEEAYRSSLTSAKVWAFVGDVKLCQPFISTWQTTALGESITIPTTGGGYAYDVDWGDASSPSIGITGNATHVYAAAGVYTVSISGDFPRIYFNNNGDKLKIKSVEQWGGNPWQSVEGAFAGCANLLVNDATPPVLDFASSMKNMFKGNTTALANVANWNVSTIANMSGVFSGCISFNTELLGWNTALVITMDSLFYGCTLLDKNLGNLNVEAVTSMKGMLDNTAFSPINYLNTLASWGTQNLQPNVELGAAGIAYCAGANQRDALTLAPHNWNIQGDILDCKTPLVSTWQTDIGATAITIPTQGAGFYYDVDWENDGIYDDFALSSSATHDYGVAGTHTVAIRGNYPRIKWNGKTQVISIEQWGSTTWADLNSAFSGCTNLTVSDTAGVPDLSALTSLSTIFYGTALGTTGNLGSWDVSSITYMEYPFDNCPNFNQDIGSWNVSNVDNMYFTYEGMSVFNQYLGDWDISQAIEIEFSGLTGMSVENADRTLIAWTKKIVLTDGYLYMDNTPYCAAEADLLLISQQTLVGKFTDQQHAAPQPNPSLWLLKNLVLGNHLHYLWAIVRIAMIILWQCQIRSEKYRI